MSRSLTLSRWIRTAPAVAFTIAALATNPVLAAEKKPGAADTMAQKASFGGGQWAYHGDVGPENWGNLSPSYAACGVGQSQSPVDLRNADTARMQAIGFDYRVTPIDLVHNGHTIEAAYKAGSSISIGDDRYDLLQFHFHTPSEHKIGGQAYPMEIHFVHKHQASGRLAVVGVLVAPGDHNLAAQEIWDNLPEKANSMMDKPRVLINGRDLLPGNLDYFRYMGSLTTPPCSEGVSWYVLQSPVQFSAAQIDRIGKLMGYNARPTQPRNHRMVLKAGGM
ncbi:MAG: carbonic anhydrase family protein [Rhodospirillales bacterium]|nr:carbonic anhydrase family protein [Rhodospirillales bacterium]